MPKLTSITLLLATLTTASSSLSLLASSTSDCQYQTIDGTCYGPQLRAEEFYLADNFTNLNHGSFGTVPRSVHEAQEQFFIKQEQYPDRWFREQYYQALDLSRDVIAKYVGADANDVVLVENASSAVNAILRSMGLQSGDKVLRLSTAYGMVVNTLNYLSESVGIRVLVADVKYPVAGADQIVSTVRKVLQEHPDVKLCVFSHISSMPAIVEPLHELVDTVHSVASSSAQVLVDGAHAPGQIELSIPSYGVDYYLGNCHKWLYAPKGTAFLWVDPTHQTESFPEPTVISSKNALGLDFAGRFSYTGTRDYTAFSALPAALEFRRYLGGEDRIREYCHNLAVEAGAYLASAWGTELLVPATMSGYMINVILPSNNATAIKAMQQELNEKYRIYIVYGSMDIVAVDKGEKCKHQKEDTNKICATKTLYSTRLSAQVYLDMDAFRPLAHLVPQLLGVRGDEAAAVDLDEE
mmetsp:Transcript_25600/g.56005  ORF Transcript_25600/g.56005 Transcript_25600/m.56005 type:complete len:467 (-) Transcript_25600:1324-2724(-)